MIYYIKQDDTIWGCGDPECCGEYYKDLKESFVDMPEGVEITALALQRQMGGGPVLEFREATHLECLSWYLAYNEGYSEGYSEGHTKGQKDNVDYVDKLWPLIDK